MLGGMILMTVYFEMINQDYFLLKIQETYWALDQ